MTHTASVLNSHSEFDSFLFAPVGESDSGTPITVLSALARLDFDPWQEAAELARLPKDVARGKLAKIVAAIPGLSADRRQPGSIAARLVALLPGSASATMPETVAGVPVARPGTKRPLNFLVMWAIVMMIVLVGQSLMSASQQPAPASPNAASSVPSTAQPTPSQPAAPLASPASGAARSFADSMLPK
jgi:hypothetical protein